MLSLMLLSSRLQRNLISFTRVSHLSYHYKRSMSSVIDSLPEPKRQKMTKVWLSQFFFFQVQPNEHVLIGLDHWNAQRHIPLR